MIQGDTQACGCCAVPQGALLLTQVASTSYLDVAWRGCVEGFRQPRPTLRHGQTKATTCFEATPACVCRWSHQTILSYDCQLVQIPTRKHRVGERRSLHYRQSMSSPPTNICSLRRNGNSSHHASSSLV